MQTVLIVDDDPAFLQTLEKMLVTAGYKVLRAVDGTQAVDILEKNNKEIDLAIVDLALPGINGFEIIGALSRRPNPVKIIATTSIYKDAHLAMAGTLGAHAAIRKPPPVRPLPERDWLSTVQRLIGNSETDKLTNAARVSGARNDSEPSNETKAKQ